MLAIDVNYRWVDLTNLTTPEGLSPGLPPHAHVHALVPLGTCGTGQTTSVTIGPQSCGTREWGHEPREPNSQ